MQKNKALEHQVIRSAIDQISLNNKYQIILTVFLCFVFQVMSYSTFSPSILYMNPQFQCQGIDGKASEENACQIIDFCTLSNNYTLTAKLHLYCGSQADQRNTIQAAYGLGAMLGVLIINYISGINGKKLGFKIGLLLACLHSYSLLIGAVWQDPKFLILSQFLAGASHMALLVLSYLMLQKYTKASFHPIIVSLVNLFGSGLGQMIVGAYTQVFKTWKVFLVITTIPYTVLFLLSFWVIKEDPFYLFDRNRLEQLETLIKEVATINCAEPHLLEKALFSIEHLQNSKVMNFSETTTPSIGNFLTRSIVKNMIALSSMLMASNILYFGNQYEIENFSISPSLSLAVFGFSEVLIYLLIIIWADEKMEMSRKRIVILSGTLTSILCLILSFQFIKEITILQMVLIFVMKVIFGYCSTYSTSYYLFIFPKPIENMLIGFVQFIGNFGKIMAPVIVRIANSNKKPSLAIFGIIFMVMMIFPAFFLPENQQEALQQSFIKNNQKMIKTQPN